MWVIKSGQTQRIDDGTFPYWHGLGWDEWEPGHQLPDPTTGDARKRVSVTSTEDGYELVSVLNVGNSAAATTPGSVVKKIQVFDLAGTSLGYIPVYGAIT